jgi:acetyl esterase/lipase
MRPRFRRLRTLTACALFVSLTTVGAGAARASATAPRTGQALPRPAVQIYVPPVVNMQPGRGQEIPFYYKNDLAPISIHSWRISVSHIVPSACPTSSFIIYGGLFEPLTIPLAQWWTPWPAPLPRLYLSEDAPDVCQGSVVHFT